MSNDDEAAYFTFTCNSRLGNQDDHIIIKPCCCMKDILIRYTSFTIPFCLLSRKFFFPTVASEPYPGKNILLTRSESGPIYNCWTCPIDRLLLVCVVVFGQNHVSHNVKIEDRAYTIFHSTVIRPLLYILIPYLFGLYTS